MPDDTNASNTTPLKQTKPKVEIAFGDDLLNHQYMLVTVGDKSALLSPADLMLTVHKFAEKLNDRGVLVVDPDTIAEIKAAAKATDRKPTFKVPRVTGWHLRGGVDRPDLYLHGSTPIGNTSGVYIDPALVVLGDRPGSSRSAGRAEPGVGG